MKFTATGSRRFCGMTLPGNCCRVTIGFPVASVVQDLPVVGVVSLFGRDVDCAGAAGCVAEFSRVVVEENPHFLNIFRGRIEGRHSTGITCKARVLDVDVVQHPDIAASAWTPADADKGLEQ